MPVDCGVARERLHGLASRLERQGRRAILERARALARLARAPADQVDRHRAHLHQQSRELRASVRRAMAGEERRAVEAAGVLERRGSAATVAARRSRELDRLRLALAAHDPQRMLERGYALVEDDSGEPVSNVAAARGHQRLMLRMSDGALPVRPES